MDELRIPVTDIREDGLQVEEHFTAAALQPEGAEPLPEAQATIRGTLTAMGEEVLFRGTIHGTFTQPCDRCLEPVALPFSVDCTWFFEPDNGDEGEEEDEEVCRLDGDIVDLGHYAWEEMSLALPAKFVCPPETPCAGREWMEQQADKDEEGPHAASPFAQLKGLFTGDVADSKDAGPAGDDK